MFVVDFQQDVHAERLRGLFEVLCRAVVDRRHNDQDAISLPRPRFGHLINVVHEILAQDRKLGRSAIWRRPRSWRRNGRAWLPRSLRACRPLCWREYRPSRLLGPWIRLVRGKTHRVMLMHSKSRPGVGAGLRLRPNRSTFARALALV